MEKTLIALLALSSLAMGIEIHGVTFEATLPTPMHTAGYDKSQNFYVDAFYYGNASTATTYGGFYVTANGGIKTNDSNKHSDVTYLYLDPSIVFATGNTGAGQIGWSGGTNNYYGITATEGAWVDINAAYGNKIHVDAMTNGTVYLNDKGSLTSTLSESNKVHATLLTEDYENVDGYEYNEATQVLTRTLMLGNFSTWTSAETGIVLDNLNELDSSRVGYLANGTGLYVTYNMANVPEPTTGALSLLALAGLCIRRRK